MVTPQKNGILFEDKMQVRLETTKLKIYREKDVKHRYGKHITAIDHLVIYKNKMLFCIQDKWIAGKVSNSQLNHFINCINTLVENNKEFKNQIILGLYVSNNGLSSYASEQLNIENKKFINKKSKIKYIDINNSNEKLLLDDVIHTINNNIIHYYKQKILVLIYILLLYCICFIVIFVLL